MKDNPTLENITTDVKSQHNLTFGILQGIMLITLVKSLCYLTWWTGSGWHPRCPHKIHVCPEIGVDPCEGSRLCLQRSFWGPAVCGRMGHPLQARTWPVVVGPREREGSAADLLFHQGQETQQMPRQLSSSRVRGSEWHSHRQYMLPSKAEKAQPVPRLFNGGKREVKGEV